jgi:hypothetical protein
MDQAKEDNIAYVNNDLVTGRKTMTRTTWSKVEKGSWEDYEA